MKAPTYRKGDYRINKLNGMYVILDNRGKDHGHFEYLSPAIAEIDRILERTGRTLDAAWEDLGRELHRMGNEKPKF